MPSIPESTHERKSREQICLEALDAIVRIAEPKEHGHIYADHMELALEDILGTATNAIRHANTCVICGHVGSPADSVVDGVEIMGFLSGGPFRHERLCEDRSRCNEREQEAKEKEKR